MNDALYAKRHRTLVKCCLGATQFDDSFTEIPYTELPLIKTNPIVKSLDSKKKEEPKNAEM